MSARRQPQRLDAVSGVLEVSSADIDPAPGCGARIRADFIGGMGTGWSSCPI
jgi:hypothetical protein